MAMPCKGHLDQLFHTSAFLKNKHNSEMVFDPSEPDIDESQFSGETWTDTVYGDCSEDIPPNAPACLGFGFKICVFVDSDHAGDLVTQRSRTGFIVFLNNAPSIYWT